MVEDVGDGWTTNNLGLLVFIGNKGMAGLVAVTFIVLVFGLLMAYFLGDRFMRKSVVVVVAVVFGGLALGFGFGALVAWIVMLLWNSCVVPLGVAAVGFWQAWGIMLLCGVLFKGGLAASIESYFKNKKK
jgi:RsiW-degrading membrane proteinase PrsW (M82 family)